MGANISVCFLNSSTPEFSLSLDEKRCEKDVIEDIGSPTPQISKDLVSLKIIFDETERVVLNEEDQIDEDQSDSEQSVLAEACVSPSTSSRRNSPCRFPSPRDVNFELKNDEERETMKRFQNHIDRNENKDVTLESIGLDHINVNNDLVTNPEGLYPLHIAVLQSDVSMIQQLLNDGAYLHVKDQTGKTPLANAFALGNTEIIDILVAAKEAEFQHSPYSPYAPSCATRSSSGSFCGDNEKMVQHLPYGSEDIGNNIFASRNSSFRSTNSATFELRHRSSSSRDLLQPAIHHSSPLCISTDEPMKMQSIATVQCATESCSEATTLPTADEEDMVGAMNAAESSEQPPLFGPGLSLPIVLAVDTATACPPLASLTRQKAKKPLVNRLQKAAGKMFSYVRPPKHTGTGSVSSSSQSYSSENESPTSKVSLSLSDV